MNKFLESVAHRGLTINDLKTVKSVNTEHFRLLYW